MEFICSLTLTEYYPNDVPQTCTKICPHHPPTRKNGWLFYLQIYVTDGSDLLDNDHLRA